MNFDLKKRNIPLDAGLVILAANVFAGLVVLVFGLASGKMQQSKGHEEKPPTAGQVPDERHQNISGAASR